MIQSNQIIEIDSSDKSKKFVHDLGHFRRTEHGCFVKKLDKDNQVHYKKIASHAVRVSKIVFVLWPRDIEVRYVLRFFTGTRFVEIGVSHTDLTEEKAFLGVAPPGFSLKRQSFHELREMLMLDLDKAKHYAAVTTLGWYVWKGKTVFAHAAGVICSESDWSNAKEEPLTGTSQHFGIIDIDKACSDVPILMKPKIDIKNVVVVLPEQLNRYRLELPESIEELRSAIREVFHLLALGDANVTYLSVAALFYTTLCNPRFAVFLHGETGSLKTAFALLLLSFFVDDPQESDLASFKSTENALRARFSATGNVPVVVDDFIESPGHRGSSQTAEKADNIIRSIVNGNGKERATQIGGLRPNDRPQGLAIVTGETFPKALESLKHRTINIEVDKSCFRNSIQGSRDNEFSRLQKLAASGVFRKVMAAFIAWSTKRFERLHGYLNQSKDMIPTSDHVHLRLPDAANQLMSGFGAFLNFAREVQAISEEEFSEHAYTCIDAIREMLDRAYLESLEDCSTEQFAQKLQAALVAQKCHIEVKEIENHFAGELELPLDLLGYSEKKIVVPNVSDSDEDREGSIPDDDEEPETRTVYHARGDRIGWIHNDCIDLIPDATLAVINSLASRSEGKLFPDKKTFGKMLASKGWIAQKSRDRNTQKVRRGDTVIDVWRIHAWRLFEPAIPWGDFDAEYYKEMSYVERRKLLDQKCEERLSALRQRLTGFQADSLLNNHLTVEDRNQLFRTDPPVGGDFETVNGVGERYEPQPPETRPLLGCDDPEGDGLLA